MHIRFLLGPAGSGKTHRCLAEILEHLRASPDGVPLLLLAPKQATFQLERQLLDFGGWSGRPREPIAAGASGSRGRSPHHEDVCPLQGYTRLHILSFERLAEFVFDQLGAPRPELLSEEGRVMVLRAVLEQKRGELRLFRASARLPGFARELSGLLRELQRYHLTPARLESLTNEVGGTPHLEAKLHDFALILRAYADWLKQQGLQDADQLLDLAAAALGGASVLASRLASTLAPPVSIPLAPPKAETLALGGLWLDGFAQMTPQERKLLAAVARHAERCTLAFCLEGGPEQNLPWHSPWSPVMETVSRCREELAALPGAEIELEMLERDPARSRFQDEPMLAHLEKHWGKPAPLTIDDLRFTSRPDSTITRVPGSPIRIIACANPEAEAECVAHEIRRYVRLENGRFRDVAVLVRSLEAYHHAVRRVFDRYQIPMFLDRRESIAHHPLAELTRCGLRLVAFGWEHDDWFGALKTGLVSDEEAAIDRLENEALARGWNGVAFWRKPVRIPEAPELGESVERLRKQIVPPFEKLSDAVMAANGRPTGAQLGAALRDFWKRLDAGRKLERWSTEDGEGAEESQISNLKSEIHQAAWDQMTEWLGSLELAFSAEALPLNDWLPIIEAGLGNLTVGVIPPALDQVLVGAIDRSRNPDLQVVFVLGVNEGVFPAPPPVPALLNRVDREALASCNALVGPDFRRQIGLERYYGYVACTRARRRLVLTHARRDAEGRELNASPFIGEVKRLFPEIAPENFPVPGSWHEAEHWSELIVPLLRDGVLRAQPSLLAAAPELESVAARWRQLGSGRADERIPPGLVEGIFGTELRTSVSGLEDFAACPFKFLAARGLRAEERIGFEIDPREQGSFQHEVLKEFHLRLQKAGKRWRDVSPAEARSLVREAGEALLPGFRDGLFLAAPSRRFAAQTLIRGLERLIETLVGWAKQYQFDPVAVEAGFGLKDSPFPAWRIDLDGRHALLLRGRIDRIDLFRIPGTGEALGVVIDYKSSARQLDPVLLDHGLELQLLAYLGALSHFDNVDERLKVARIVPAGAFYIALRGRAGSAKTRDEERDGREEARRAGCQHRGRFDGGQLDKFDASGRAKGDQFKYSRNKGGAFSTRGNEALPTPEFRALVVKIEDFLRQHGQGIYDGNVSVAPFRWKHETACDFCLYRPVCRFDPWTQPYRVLRAPEKP